MFGKKKGFTAAQSKYTSYRMRRSTIGTHVPKEGPVRGSHMNAASVGFSSSRKKRRAARGMVDHVTPSTASGESARAYSKRIGQRQFIQGEQRKSRARRIAVAAVSVAVVLCVAVAVGVGVFTTTSNSKLSLGDSNAASALASPVEGEPFYVLCAARLGAPAGEGGASTDAYLLARIDEQTHRLTLVSIPGNTEAVLSDGDAHPLFDAEAEGGDAELVRAVSTLAGVPIAHFVKTDAAGIEGLVDIAGGVGVTLPEEVDDPAAGSTYLPAGEQVLTGEGALTLLRAGNFTGGAQTQGENRTAFTCALAQRLLEAEGLEFASQLDRVAGCLQTDLSSQQISAMASALQPFSPTDVYRATLPGAEADRDGQKRYVAATSQVERLMALVDAGEDPADANKDDAGVADAAGVTVEVRNGGGVAGAGAELAAVLEQAGFSVGNVGNANDGGDYADTLVVVKDEDSRSRGNAVVKALGVGRVVIGGDFYSFDTDVLVMVGRDWQPLA